MIRPYFSSREDYATQFTDPNFWHPYVAEVCARHQLGCHTIRAGLPGTNAVFLVDQQYAVKLYTDLFGGAHSYPAERECYAMIAAAGSIPAPALIASGDLFGLFHGDTRLLRACLAAYGDPAMLINLPQRAMIYTLLFEFAVLEDVQDRIMGLATLDEVADVLWVM